MKSWYCADLFSYIYRRGHKATNAHCPTMLGRTLRFACPSKHAEAFHRNKAHYTGIDDILDKWYRATTCWTLHNKQLEIYLPIQPYNTHEIYIDPRHTDITTHELLKSIYSTNHTQVLLNPVKISYSRRSAHQFTSNKSRFPYNGVYLCFIAKNNTMHTPWVHAMWLHQIPPFMPN